MWDGSTDPSLGVGPYPFQENHSGLPPTGDRLADSQTQADFRSPFQASYLDDCRYQVDWGNSVDCRWGRYSHQGLENSVDSRSLVWFPQAALMVESMVCWRTRVGSLRGAMASCLRLVGLAVKMTAGWMVGLAGKMRADWTDGLPKVDLPKGGLGGN